MKIKGMIVYLIREKCFTARKFTFRSVQAVKPVCPTLPKAITEHKTEDEETKISQVQIWCVSFPTRNRKKKTLLRPECTAVDTTL
jgi:hypothetical protein